jgi:hypothetical protein
LIDACGGWVPLPDILALGIALYNARIFELRRLGFFIENRTEEIDGVRHSWFRLVSSSQATPDRTKNTESNFMKQRRRKKDEAAPLFAEMRK